MLIDSGVVVGTSLSKYLLEKSRVVFQVRTMSEVCGVFNIDIMKASMMLHLLVKQISPGPNLLQYISVVKSSTSHWH